MNNIEIFNALQMFSDNLLFHHKDDFTTDYGDCVFTFKYSVFYNKIIYVNASPKTMKYVSRFRLNFHYDHDIIRIKYLHKEYELFISDVLNYYSSTEEEQFQYYSTMKDIELQIIDLVHNVLKFTGSL